MNAYESLKLDNYNLLRGRKPYLINGYPCISIDNKHVKVHHLVMGKPRKGLEVDHINRDKMDNRRENLRFVSRQENNLNRGAWGKSGERCVFLDKTCKRNKPWKVEVKRHGKKFTLGYFLTVAEGAKARDSFLQTYELGGVRL